MAQEGAGDQRSAGSAPPLLELRGIDKRFPACLANDGVDLGIRAGEIHALLGENGAGKSTLVKIAYGALQPDAGEILWQGQPVALPNPAAARRLGIGMVFQNFSLFESLSAAENIALAVDDPAARRSLRARILRLERDYDLAFDPDAIVHDLSAGERQRLEILRCLLQAPKLLIMDEPTSVLTPQEVEKLFATLRRLAAEGCAILYISHKLQEIRRLCQRATVLRQGRVVAECDPRRESAKRLAELMLGEALPAAAAAGDAAPMPPRLIVDALSVPTDRPFGTDLKAISFSVAGGEILGIAGIAGNGQAELMAALSGEIRTPRGEAIRLDGRAIGRLGPAERREAGAGFAPEDRHGHGAVAEMNLSENGLLSAYRRRNLVRRGLIDAKAASGFAGAIIADFAIRAEGPRAAARALSGGNLQRFIIGREILLRPRLLVAAQPTWGVDAAAAAAIHRALRALAAAGAAILVISQDLDEIMALADRVAVIAAGRLSAPRPAAAVSVEELGLLMGGAGAAHAA